MFPCPSFQTFLFFFAAWPTPLWHSFCKRNPRSWPQIGLPSITKPALNGKVGTFSSCALSILLVTSLKCFCARCTHWRPQNLKRTLVKFSTISQLTTHVPLSNHMQKPQGDCVPLSLAHNSPPARLESLMTDPYLKNSSDSSDKEKNFYATRSKSQDSIFSSSFGNFPVVLF